MPDHLGADQRRVKEDDGKDDKPIHVLDEGDIALLKTYGQGAYAKSLKSCEDDIQKLLKSIDDLTGLFEVCYF